MGGMGSGNWYRWDTRATVEQSLVLDMAKFRGHVLDGRSGNATWTRRGGESSIGWRFHWAGDHMVLTLNYRHGQQDVRIPVRLQTTPVHFGGFRWWFTCPLIVRGRACERRVAKLYSARSPYFGCRQCMRLTYESCRDSQTKARLWAELRR